jgi:hypothetical protein
MNPVNPKANPVQIDRKSAQSAVTDPKDVGVLDAANGDAVRRAHSAMRGDPPADARKPDAGNWYGKRLVGDQNQPLTKAASQPIALGATGTKAVAPDEWASGEGRKNAKLMGRRKALLGMRV